jgi:hypothetical protein
MVSLRWILVFGSLLVFLGAGIVVAHAATDPTSLPTLFSDIGSFGNFIIDKVGTFLFTALIAVAVIFIIYAAYLYLLSEGEPEKIKTALNTLVYALIAIVVALISRSLVFTVQNFFS